MNTKYKQTRAKALLKECRKEIEERTKYIEHMQPIYGEDSRFVQYSKGYIEALRFVISEVLQWF